MDPDASVLRIGTWNLECGGRSGRAAARQRERLAAVRADVMVYTEPGPDLSTPSPERVVSAAVRRLAGGDTAWVAIVGAGPLSVATPAPTAPMAAAAEAVVRSERVIVYGSVLPWRGIRAHHPELVLPGETAGDAFERVLAAQVEDVRALQGQNPGALVVWAGDFNQSLVGPNLGGSARGRERLREALASLDFVAWNAELGHAEEGLCAIDLVCGPRGRRVASRERIAPGRESDHAGGVVGVG